MYYFDVLGKNTKQDINKGEPLLWEDIL